MTHITLLLSILLLNGITSSAVVPRNIRETQNALKKEHPIVTFMNGVNFGIFFDNLVFPEGCDINNIDEERSVLTLQTMLLIPTVYTCVQKNECEPLKEAYNKILETIDTFQGECKPFYLTLYKDLGKLVKFVRRPDYWKNIAEVWSEEMFFPNLSLKVVHSVKAFLKGEIFQSGVSIGNIVHDAFLKYPE
jgi:hypothetical protein